jgi:hypothetical protein
MADFWRRRFEADLSSISGLRLKLRSNDSTSTNRKPTKSKKQSTSSNPILAAPESPG